MGVEKAVAEREAVASRGKLSDSHTGTYKREGKVMRRVAKQCEGVPRPVKPPPKITPQEALEACDALGFERGTVCH